MGDILALDKKTRKVVWKDNILRSFGAGKPTWGVSYSTVIHENMLITSPLGEKAGVVAYDKEKGTVLWKSPTIKGKASYATPVVTTVAGIKQVLVLTTVGITAVDASNGKILWHNGDWQCRIPIAHPVHLGNGRIFISGGYDAGSVMYKVSRTSSGFSAKTEWMSKKCNGQIHQPLLIDGHFFLNGNDKKKRNGFQCLGLDGSLKWETGRDPGFDWGGYLYADGMIYVVDGSKGDLCLVKPSTKKYIEVSRFHVLDGPEIWAPIAMADGMIVLRDQKKIRCVQVK
jgi:outer membrane protein assembly factor BamB